MKYIKGFDGLRGISILFVMLSHLGVYNYLVEQHILYKRIPLLINGTAGVYMFFGLSGFLITRILLLEKDTYSRIHFLQFYAKRFLRLLPPLFIFFSLIFVCMYFGVITRTYGGLFISAMYLYNFVPNKYYTGELAHTWSLGVEEQFYLIWPFIISYFNKYRLFLVVAILMILSVFAVIVLPYIYIPMNGSRLYLSTCTHLERYFFPAVGPIMIGSAFAVFIHYYQTQCSQLFEKNQKILVLLLIVYCIPLFIPEKTIPFSFLFLSLGASGLLVWVYHNQESSLTALLELKPLSYLGKISYGVYVYQGFFLRNGPNSGTLDVQGFPYNIILTILLAILSYEFYEKYFLKLKKKTDLLK